MKVYELSKKYKVSNNDLIDVLKTLEISKSKKVNTFTTLAPNDLQAIDKYFNKGSSKKKVAKAPEVHTEVLILKKATKVQEDTKETKKDTEEESLQEEKLEQEETSTIVGQIKEDLLKEKIKQIPKTVKVKRKVVKVVRKEALPETIETETKKDLSVKNENEAAKLKEEVPVDKKALAKDNSNKKDFIQLNKTPRYTKESKGKARPDTWNRFGKQSQNKGPFKRRFRNKIQDGTRSKKPMPKVLVSSVPSSIKIMGTITVSALAKKLNIKAGAIIAKLISMGVMATINQVIDSDTASIVASEYNCETQIISFYDETVIDKVEDKESELEPRSPIITVMGHVDHGKTKLLDALRESDITSTEDGGITQHIGAYQVVLNEKNIVFLDTPGHAAFTAMRARGAAVTDIVVLVVAADDGVMSQTIEAANHAKAAGVSIIVAINKIDSPSANTEKVKQQLADIELVPEEWGGKTITVEVSALKKQGLDTLLDSILVESEMLELKANPNRMAMGSIIESQIDKGRGSVATVLVQNGTLRIGDYFVSGVFYGKVRAIFNDRGQSVQLAPPSTPVEVLGLDGVPEAGDPFDVIADEKFAKQIAQKRQELKKISKAKDVKKLTLSDISKQIQEGEIQELKVVLKGDVQGSVEAIKEAFEQLGNDEVAVKVIHAATGAINESDVMLASASKAIIVGFHVHPNTKALLLAKREHVEIRKHSIIYDAIDGIKAALGGLISPDLQEDITGEVEVRQVFRIPKVGIIAGCYVTSGKITKSAKVRILRDRVEIYTGEILALKRFKNDVSEAKEGFECGLSVKNYQDIKVGDVIEGFVIKEIARSYGS